MAGRVRKEGNNWCFELELGKGPDGKRKRTKKRGFKTKKEALAALAGAETDFNKGIFIEGEKVTFGEYLEFWLEHYAEINTRPKTYEGYCYIIRTHIIPSLGHISLSKLTPLHLQSYYTNKLKNGRADGIGGLSAQSVKHHHRLISKALKDAVKWQKVVRNVSEAVDPPKPRKIEMRTLTVDQVNQLLDMASHSNQYYPIIFTAVHTGMRRGELQGLRWKDIDFKNGVINVRQTLQRVDGKGFIFKEPKSGKGRTVTMTKQLVEMLKKHKSQQNRSKLMLGEFYQDQDLVFTQINGNPLQPSELTRIFKRILCKANLPEIRFHDLRHTHATLMLQQNVHAKVVSERLGHSTIGITLDTYSHVLPNMQKEAVTQFELLLDSEHSN